MWFGNLQAKTKKECADRGGTEIGAFENQRWHWGISEMMEVTVLQGLRTLIEHSLLQYRFVTYFLFLGGIEASKTMEDDPGQPHWLSKLYFRYFSGFPQCGFWALARLALRPPCLRTCAWYAGNTSQHSLGQARHPEAQANDAVSWARCWIIL